jgi:hypothetical protein
MKPAKSYACAAETILQRGKGRANICLSNLHVQSVLGGQQKKHELFEGSMSG